MNCKIYLLCCLSLKRQTILCWSLAKNFYFNHSLISLVFYFVVIQNEFWALEVCCWNLQTIRHGFLDVVGEEDGVLPLLLGGAVHGEEGEGDPREGRGQDQQQRVEELVPLVPSPDCCHRVTIERLIWAYFR